MKIKTPTNVSAHKQENIYVFFFQKRQYFSTVLSELRKTLFYIQFFFLMIHPQGYFFPEALERKLLTSFYLFL